MREKFELIIVLEILRHVRGEALYLFWLDWLEGERRKKAKKVSSRTSK